MSEIYYLGIDTSNYTTSVAAVNDSGQVIANLKLPLPVKPRERGLRQSDALFAHTKQLPILMRQLQELLSHMPCPMRLGGVGYSSRPRRVEGSYMPCFLAGISAAQAAAVAADVPTVEVSHQEGHLMAALASSGAADEMLRTPFIAFHVSGGTTEMLHVTPKHESFEVQVIGRSLDLHAGQAVDRIGVAMGMSFPAGVFMEAAAGECALNVPKPRIHVRGCDCHLSGLENLALALYEKTKDVPLTAAYTLDFIAATLLAMSRAAIEQWGTLPLLFAGGVMSNRRIREAIVRQYPTARFAEPAFSADNAAGVALLCYRNLHKMSLTQEGVCHE